MPRRILAPLILQVLKREPLTASQIAQRIGAHQSTVSGALNRLEAHSRVERQGKNGAEIVWAKLTPTYM